MKDKTTDSLTEELMSSADIDTYLQRNQDSFSDQSIAGLLRPLYEKKGLSKAMLARKSGMSDLYLHQVFSCRRNPSRDRLICLCAALEVTLEETQELLRQAGYAQLYPRHRRDAIIIHGLLRHMEPSEINDKLFAENEKALF